MLFNVLIISSTRPTLLLCQSRGRISFLIKTPGLLYTVLGSGLNSAIPDHLETEASHTCVNSRKQHKYIVELTDLATKFASQVAQKLLSFNTTTVYILHTIATHA